VNNEVSEVSTQSVESYGRLNHMWIERLSGRFRFVTVHHIFATRLCVLHTTTPHRNSLTHTLTYTHTHNTYCFEVVIAAVCNTP
jgi:hypothetical protein